MLGTNSLWILGLSVLLAAGSYQDWLAKATHRRRRDICNEASWKLFVNAAMVLTFVGWGLAQTERWWEKTAWFVLAAFFAWDCVKAKGRRPT